jgi:hypothetical protein
MLAAENGLPAFDFGDDHVVSGTGEICYVGVS